MRTQRASHAVGSSRRTNLALLVLVPAALASGVLMWAAGSGWGRWPTLAHGMVGVAVVVLSPWKSVVSRRGLRRRGVGPGIPGLALAALVVVALVSGFAHRAGAREMGPVLLMQIHVGAALSAIPLLWWHVVSRPTRPRPADLGRRALLRAAALAGGAGAVTVALPRAGRGVTGSLERGSFQPSAMPVTQWLFDRVPDVDGGEWRLQVGGRQWSQGELEGLVDTEVAATLDCTGGWYARQRWTGVRLDRLLELSAAAGGRSIEVRSVTGYSRRFPRHDAARLLLATQVDGEPLSAGHGFPAPPRRAEPPRVLVGQMGERGRRRRPSLVVATAVPGHLSVARKLRRHRG